MRLFPALLGILTPIVCCVAGDDAGSVQAQQPSRTAQPAGKPVVREIQAQGYRVRLDLSPQVLGIDIREETIYDRPAKIDEDPISPTLRPLAEDGFVAAAVLAQKAKQFDDGLYAAVDVAAQQGAGSFAGKAKLLAALTRALAGLKHGDAGNVPGVVFGAARVGGVPADVPPNLAAAVETEVTAFLRDELRSKPIGFYTWNADLGRIFRQDRMLQTELKGLAGIDALVQALHRDAALRKTYEQYLALVARLTNPLVAERPDLRKALGEIDARRAIAVDKGIWFFPPSRAHETELVKKLFGDRPVPPGFDLQEELVRRIRTGQLNLAPTPESGWYDHQTWALEPLVVPEKTNEASRLRLSDTYRKHLIELFKGLQALTRETHIKQLEIAEVGGGMPPREPIVIAVRPELAAEPLCTYYLRRAGAYLFVRQAIVSIFGEAALARMKRLRADGPVGRPLGAELADMESLFRGAHAVTSRQLGRAPDPKDGTPADEASFRQWSATMADDVDLAGDSRMMVPVFYDILRKKTKVWVVLGWTKKNVVVSFAKEPVATVLDAAGAPVGPSRVTVRFASEVHALIQPVVAEVYVTRILNREEFRRHCDTYKTRSAILSNLK